MAHHHAFERIVEKSGSGEFRVLVVPTSLDFQLEQEYLKRYVFPELESLCMERSATFTEVDLRWSERDTTPAHLLLRSLEEIDRRAPLIIGIIGSRYGYIPGIEELQREPDLFRRFPAICAAAAKGCGLIELELVEGVLNNGAMAERALFYIQETGEDIDTAESEEARSRLHLLKEKIRNKCLYRIFRTPEELVELARNDVRRIIDKDYPAEDIAGILRRERRAQDAYAASRAYEYREHRESAQRFREHLAGEGMPLVVSGESGTGAFLARECSRYKEEHPGGFVVVHHIGATMGGTNHVAILRRVMLEIKERCEQARRLEEIPADTRNIADKFSFWLGFITDEPLILVLDGLENLDEQSRDLSWLPRYFQPNVRVVVSTNDREMLEEFQEREWIVIPLEPPSFDSYAMMDGFHPMPGNRSLLFDATRALGETGPTGKEGKMEDHARRFLDAGTGEFFSMVLQEYERKHSSPLVKGVLSLLAAARRGLTRRELLGIIDEDRDGVQALLDALPPYVIPGTNDLLSIRDSRMRDAVRKEYATIISQAHRRIAAYFENQGTPTIRMIDELPWQLEQLKDWKGLRTFLADLENFVRLVTDERRFDLVHYWRVLEQNCDVVQVYREAIEKIKEQAPQEKIARLRLDVGEFLTLLGKYPEALFMLKESEEYYSQAGDARESARFLTQLGIIHQTFGNYLEADSAFGNAVRVSSENLAGDDPVALAAMEGMGSLLYDRYRYEEAENLFDRIKTLKESMYEADDYRIAPTLNSLGAVYQACGRFMDASKLFHQARDISIHHYGSEHPEVALHFNNLGTLYITTGVMDEAMGALKRAYEINEKMLGPEHPETARTLINQGLAHRRNGDVKLARAKYEKALSAAEKYFHPRHLFVATILINLAALVRRMGAEGEREAHDYLRRALDIYRENFGNNHPDTAAAMLNLGSVLKQMKRYEESEPLYCAGIPLRLRYLGIEDQRTVNAIRAYADLLENMGRHKEAEEVRREFEDMFD